jgi:hypothetical protein
MAAMEDKDDNRHSFPPRVSNLPETASTEQDASLTSFTAALPPVDEGYAWIFLAASFVIETLAFGFLFSIGIVFTYWTTVLFPEPSAVTTITLASTLASGLTYVAAPVVGPLYARYPEHRAKIQYAGLLLSVAGLFGTAFVTKPWHLLITAGFMYSIGACTYYFPAATLLFTWWQRRRGMAFHRRSYSFYAKF